MFSEIFPEIPADLTLVVPRGESVPMAGAVEISIGGCQPIVSCISSVSKTLNLYGQMADHQ